MQTRDGSPVNLDARPQGLDQLPKELADLTASFVTGDDKDFMYNMDSQDGFLRTQEEEYKIVVMEDIDDIIDNEENVTDNPIFTELQHGDIVYNEVQQDSRENAFNAIMVDSEGQ